MPSDLPRPVKLLGWTSLFTDAATEAIYPLLPLFVTRVLGGTALALGLIEGAADAMSSLLKLVAGSVSDRTGRRKPFVVIGYAVASLSRPLMALAGSWQHVFAVRLADRVGKGLRGAPRDAMLGALAPDGQRGRIFGYHRGMDHAGAVVGPGVAAVFLWLFPGEFRTLFALTIVPGAIAVGTVLLVPETRGSALEPRTDDGTLQSTQRVAEARASALGSPPAVKRFLISLALFTLGNSTDAFLLLRLSDAGLGAAYLPLAWAGLHVVKAGLSAIGGACSDRLGRRPMIVAGWLWYAVVYVGFALSEALLPLLGWFFAYGLHFAMVEGSERALVADLSPGHLQGTSFGWYNAVLGFGALAASILFGAIWEAFGPSPAFLTGAGLAVSAAILLGVDPAAEKTR